jgi:hypothetical protein
MTQSQILARKPTGRKSEPAGRSRAGQVESSEIPVVEVIAFHAHADERKLPIERKVRKVEQALTPC